MAKDKLDRLDYYTLLGVPKDAQPQDIRRAFRSFARRYHPDRFAHTEADKRERATEIYRRGSEGLQVLCDPDARAAYDAGLPKGVVRLRADERDQASRAKNAPPKKAGPAIRSTEAKAYFDKGRALYEERNFREAWKALKKALALEPGNTAIHKAIAKVDAILRRGG